MSEIKFHKMVASGNDFIVLDNRKKAVRDAKRFAEEFCRPHVSIGADGVLLVERSKKADFLMRILNADGSEAEACGNGFRCIGLYAHQLLGFKKQMRVETLSGEISISLKGKHIVVDMIDPYDFKQNVALSGVGANGNVLKCAFVNTGVPHAVLFADQLESISVGDIGKAIRFHKVFQPKGTNVDFVQVSGPNALSVRTYERGVEAETLACGTGVTAAAVVANLTGRVSAPVTVTTKSGDAIIVHMKPSGSTVRNVSIEGTAQFVFEGRLTL